MTVVGFRRTSYQRIAFFVFLLGLGSACTDETDSEKIGKNTDEISGRLKAVNFEGTGPNAGLRYFLKRDGTNESIRLNFDDPPQSASLAKLTVRGYEENGAFRVTDYEFEPEEDGVSSASQSLIGQSLVKSRTVTFAIVDYFNRGVNSGLATAALIRSNRAKELSDEARTKALEALTKAEESQTNSQMVAVEIQLRALIDGRSDKMTDVMRDLEILRNGRQPHELTETDKMRAIDAGGRLAVAREGYLNAYDRACAAYRDNKVDKSRFNKDYHDDINNLVAGVDAATFRELLHPKGTKYRAIFAVYDEWFDLENKL